MTQSHAQTHKHAHINAQKHTHKQTYTHTQRHTTQTDIVIQTHTQALCQASAELKEGWVHRIGAPPPATLLLHSALPALHASVSPQHLLLAVFLHDPSPSVAPMLADASHLCVQPSHIS